MAVSPDAESGKVGILDVETTYIEHGKVPETKFWGLYVEGEEYRRFGTSVSLAHYLDSRRDKIILYHHHDFDPIQYLVDKQALQIRDVRSGRLLRCYGPSSHEWRNSYALFPAALKTILNECGFEKPDLTDLDARNIADTVDACKAFRMLSDAYQDTWGIYPLARNYLTASGVAFAAAQRAAGRLPSFTDLRECYRGGRVEAFRIGYCGEADCYDINSSYPAAFIDLPERDHLLRVEVTVDTDGPSPCWYAPPDAEKLLFPVGKFQTWVWASSYEKYIKPHGRVRAMKALERPILVDMRWIKEVGSLVQSVYLARQEAKRRGDNVKAYAAKLGLNSIYGRLGLKPEREIALTLDRVALDDDVTYYKLPDGKYLSFVKVESSHVQANYLFAAAITDNARCRLYDGLERCGSPYYCDTDSVFVPAGTNLSLPKGNALGQWKFEGTAHLSIQGAKDYAFGPRGGYETRRDASGYYWVDESGERIREKLPHEKFALKGGKGHHEWTIKRALSGKGARAIEKGRVTKYDKRRVLPNGSTLPINAEDISHESDD